MQDDPDKRDEIMILRMLLLLIFISAPALADDDNEVNNPAPHLQRKYDRRAIFMDQYDLNEDGVLDQDEVRDMIEFNFAAMDKDEDLSLSEAEQAAAIEKFKVDYRNVYGSLIDKRARKLMNRFKNADEDENDQISHEEYLAYFGKRYADMDKDKDGNLTVREFETDVEKD